jgi:hypothetical protein
MIAGKCFESLDARRRFLQLLPLHFGLPSQLPGPFDSAGALERRGCVQLKVNAFSPTVMTVFMPPEIISVTRLPGIRAVTGIRQAYTSTPP